MKLSTPHPDKYRTIDLPLTERQVVWLVTAMNTLQEFVDVYPDWFTDEYEKEICNLEEYLTRVKEHFDECECEL